ncbi:MAG: hypothetical protein AB7K52_07950 [Phycisphaerales bacterium]
MNGTRADIAKSAGDRLEAATLRTLRTVVGFDGFVDSIMDVVAERRTPAAGDYSRCARIEDFARRCAAAAGLSTSLEIAVREERFGGNAPLLAGALASIGAYTTLVGCVGDGAGGLHPLFDEVRRRCERSGGRVAPIAPPALTHAMEFDDGKIMLNDPRSVRDVTWERVRSVEGIREMVETARVVAVMNWTNMDAARAIIEALAREFLATVERPARLFVDLSDPARRRAEDVRGVLEVLTRAEGAARVTLAMNLAEAGGVSTALGLGEMAAGHDADGVRRGAEAIRGRLKIDTVVVHPREGAAAAREGEAAWFDGPLCARPKLSTGAGDHFNAGFIVGQMLDMTLAESLALGCAASGAYVRDATSPTRERLVEFLRTLPEPEALG